MGLEGRDAPVDDVTLTSYVKVYGFMGSILDLSGLELLVFARIYGFTACGLPFFESRAKTAEFFGSTRRAIITAVGKLKKKKLIVELEGDEMPCGGQTKAYVVNMELIAETIGIGIEGTDASQGQAGGEEASPLKGQAGEDASPASGEPLSPESVKTLHPIPKKKSN